MNTCAGGVSISLIVVSFRLVVGEVVEIFGALQFGEVDDAQATRGDVPVAFDALVHRPRTH